MSLTRWLVLRRGGCLWGVASSEVRAVSTDSTACRVELASERHVFAEAVLGVERGLDVKPVGAVLRSFVPAGCSGLASCAQGPLLVIDAKAPPAVLLDQLGASGTQPR